MCVNQNHAENIRNFGKMKETILAAAFRSHFWEVENRAIMRPRLAYWRKAECSGKTVPET